MHTFLRALVQSGLSAKLLINARKDEAVREALEAQGVKVMDETEPEPTQYVTLPIRREMKQLPKEPSSADFTPYSAESQFATTVAEVCNTSWVRDTLRKTWPTAKAKAQRLIATLSQQLQDQRNTVNKVTEAVHDEGKSLHIAFICALLMRGYALKKSDFHLRTLGLYMLGSGGVNRLVINTCHNLGLIPSYSTLNDLLATMADTALKNIKHCVHGPNAISVYENSNFLSRVQELAGGKESTFVSCDPHNSLSCLQ
jgi:hypothetical protein